MNGCGLVAVRRRSIAWHARTVAALVGLLFFTPSLAQAQGQDLDAYRFRISGFWWFVRPTGTIEAKAGAGIIDLERDFDFTDYSTFSGLFDWRFKRKHHFLFGVSPVEISQSNTIPRTITFGGQTFDLGRTVTFDLESLSFSPGYQYDIVRRNHGYFAVVVQFYLIQTEATLKGTATANGQSVTGSVSESLLAPIPAAGPRFRWYPLANSNRLALDGFVQGMYLFGYGNFLSARATVGVGLTHGLKLTGGYQMGSRLTINDRADRLGIRLTQRGPVAGVEVSW